MKMRWHCVFIFILFIMYIGANNVPTVIEGHDLQSIPDKEKGALPHVIQINRKNSPITSEKCKPTSSVTSNSCASNNMVRNISIVGDSFMLDGKPLRLVSGSLHYFRAPAAYWRDRLRKLRAAGLNAVATYVEWSFHEPEERQYRFEDDYDVSQFVRIAAEEGLLVLLRPGPYICAERDLGGLPYWLLSKYPNIRLRTTDKDFVSEMTTWFKKLFKYMTPLLYGNGGPIILVQIENEYGSYGSDVKYMESVRDAIRGHVGDSALLYTTDGSAPSYFQKGSVSGALTTIDFGTGINSNNVFGNLRKHMPSGPLMNSEFYPGWLTHWNEDISVVNTKDVIDTLRDMLDMGANVNFYVFYGGTNFEFTAGANYFSCYEPDITSYDYDAPLSEAGDPTPKYKAIRELLEKYYPETSNITVPTASEKGAYGPVSVVGHLRMLSPAGRQALGKLYKNVTGSRLPTFEQQRQRGGYILYETSLSLSENEWETYLLKISKPRDRVYVYVDGKLKGIISRMHKIYSVPIQKGDILSLLVENQGRINYGSFLHDFKGILSDVSIDEKILNGDWSIIGYSLETIDSVTQRETFNANEEKPQDKLEVGPILFEGTFTLPEKEEPKDTFLDTTGWGKGFIWINGHNLGRYWPDVGPQVTLYVPSVWLKPHPQHNVLHILEAEKSPIHKTMTFIDHPILESKVIKKLI